MNEGAFELFKLVSDGFCCTQIMMKLALDMEESENEDLIRAMGGFCDGIGGTQKECGVLTGGIGIIGLYAGKGKAKEWTKEDYGSMVREYMDWFEEHFGSLECVDMIGVYRFEDENNRSYPVKCGDTILESFGKIQEILQEHGYELGSRE